MNYKDIFARHICEDLMSDLIDVKIEELRTVHTHSSILIVAHTPNSREIYTLRISDSGIVAQYNHRVGKTRFTPLTLRYKTIDKIYKILNKK